MDDVMQFTVNVDVLSIRDLQKIDRAATGNPGAVADAIDVLGKAIEEDLDDIPMSKLKDLFNALGESLNSRVLDENLD